VVGGVGGLGFGVGGLGFGVWGLGFRVWGWRFGVGVLGLEVWGVGCHTSHLTPRPSHLTPRPSHLTPRPSHLAPHTSHLTPSHLPQNQRLVRNLLLQMPCQQTSLQRNRPSIGAAIFKHRMLKLIAHLAFKRLQKRLTPRI
jgi:hypothetical protein